MCAASIMNTSNNKIPVNLIVTCLNEEGNVQIFIDDLMQNLPPEVDLRITLINNGSSDQTGPLIDELAKTYPIITPIHRNEPLTYGASILDQIDKPIDIS